MLHAKNKVENKHLFIESTLPKFLTAARQKTLQNEIILVHFKSFV